MSLLSAVILPMLERHLVELAPAAADLVIDELKEWLESKGRQAASINPDDSKKGA